MSSGSSGKDKDDSLSKQLVVPSAAHILEQTPPCACLLSGTAALEILPGYVVVIQRRRRNRGNMRGKRTNTRGKKIEKLEERARKAEEKAKQK